MVLDYYKKKGRTSCLYRSLREIKAIKLAGTTPSTDLSARHQTANATYSRPLRLDDLRSRQCHGMSNICTTKIIISGQMEAYGMQYCLDDYARRHLSACA